MLTAARLIQVLGVYSVLFIGWLVLAVLTEGDVHDRAMLMMIVGVIALWVVLGGGLMYANRTAIRRHVRAIPLRWQVKFVLFAILLALLEEVVTVGMTNLAPAFGSEIGKAYITASANYLHTVVFHSVIVFVPWFIAWGVLLSRYAFRASHVFLLFGLTGSIGELSITPINAIAGFWFFVYGLMIYLPAYAVPDAESRVAVQPKPRHYALAVVLPFLFMLLLLPLFPLLRTLFDLLQPTFFVETPFD